MTCRLVAAVFCVLTGVTAGVRFPDGFKFGAATAAYQVEGAWNASDKSPSIWDALTHNNPEFIIDHSNGDVACNSYNLWKQDIQLASDLGLHFYRFSISWPRLLPTGFSNRVSEDGKRYYNDVIDGLLEKGIEPVATLYHWDLPQNLQDLGGWTNPLVVEWFEQYASVAFALFGDRVRTWLTLNEPLIMCEAAYTTAMLAPRIHSPSLGSYLCTRHVLLAHAAAYRLYDREFRPLYHGKVSLTNHIVWLDPLSEDFREETELTRQYGVGLFSHPIFSKRGGWPPAIEERVAQNSRREGYTRSRLPPFTEEEIDFVKGTFDFYGLNYYTSRLVRAGAGAGAWPLGGAPELGVALETHPHWGKASNSWFYVNSPALRKLLVWLKNNYGDLEYMIMENGYSTVERDIADTERTQYYKDHLQQVLNAIYIDGVNVTRYTAWSLLDNFEWADGYTTRFGLVDVDFNDPLRKRTLRDSARFYADVIASHALHLRDNEI